MKTHLSMLAMLVAAFAPLSLRAQNAPEPPKAVQITLHPMPEPRPALKYQLLPSVLDRKPGNAAVLWNGLAAERTYFFSQMFVQPGIVEKIIEWMEIPLDDPREKEFRTKHPEIALASSLNNDMARAARLESCDWQIPIHDGNFYAIPLSEVQQLRSYGRLMAATARLEIAEGKYDQAVETMQTGFAMARDAAKGQTLINGLIGAAIAGREMLAGQIEQFVQRPDAPNLYWALSTLPRPLIDFRPGFETECNNVFLQFPELRDLDKKDLSTEEWRKLLEKTFDNLNNCSGRAWPSHDATPLYVAVAVQGYPVAKQYLIEHGHRAADVEAMPVAKAILVYSVERYQELRDETIKAMFLPYAEGRKWLQRGAQTMRAVGMGKEEIIPFASLLMPASQAMKGVEVRVEWIYARLRILEALRIYAAAHDGKLPDELEDITEAPIPRNPFDDKPFDYHRDGNHAVLDCQHGPPGQPWRYEITMQPKGEKP